MKRSSPPSAATSSRLVEPTSVTTRLRAAGRQRLARPARAAPPTGPRRRRPRRPAQASAIEPAARSSAPSSDRPRERRRRAAEAGDLGAEPLAARRARSSRRSGPRRGRRPSAPGRRSTAARLDRRGEALEHGDRVLPVDAGVGDRLAVGERPRPAPGPGGPRPGTTPASPRRSPRCRRRSGRRFRRRRRTAFPGPCRCCRARRRSPAAPAARRSPQRRPARPRPRARGSSASPWPPRRMTWQSGLPVVCRIAGMPASSMPAKACEAAAARTASTATWMLPSVRFLKPIGIERPEPSWRWVWLSVVRAPIAPQATVSEMYCGVIGSRNSQPTGRPSVEHLEQQLAGDPQAGVDVAGAVEVRVVDQALPAGRRPRLLEVDPHHDQQPVAAAARRRRASRRA